MDNVMPNHHRDVRGTSKDWRVTEGHRGSAKLFVAPDVSPVGTHAAEMAKGQRDWTDMDLKVQMVDGDALAKAAKLQAERAEQMSMTVGTVLPKGKVANKAVVVSVDMTDREYEQYRAMVLAAREYYGN